jgi:hypothetical protein
MEDESAANPSEQVPCFRKPKRKTTERLCVRWIRTPGNVLETVILLLFHRYNILLLLPFFWWIVALSLSTARVTTVVFYSRNCRCRHPIVRLT